MTEINGFNLYRDGDWIPVPQTIIRQVLLQRSVEGRWIPEYPAEKPVAIGDELVVEILQAQRNRAY